MPVVGRPTFTGMYNLIALTHQRKLFSTFRYYLPLIMEALGNSKVRVR